MVGTYHRRQIIRRLTERQECVAGVAIEIGAVAIIDDARWKVQKFAPVEAQLLVKVFYKVAMPAVVIVQTGRNRPFRIGVEFGAYIRSVDFRSKEAPQPNLDIFVPGDEVSDLSQIVSWSRLIKIKQPGKILIGLGNHRRKAISLEKNEAILQPLANVAQPPRKIVMVVDLASEIEGENNMLESGKSIHAWESLNERFYDNCIRLLRRRDEASPCPFSGCACAS